MSNRSHRIPVLIPVFVRRLNGVLLPTFSAVPGKELVTVGGEIVVVLGVWSPFKPHKPFDPVDRLVLTFLDESLDHGA